MGTSWIVISDDEARFPFSLLVRFLCLKVPSGCAVAYKSASEWRRFASITGFDE